LYNFQPPTPALSPQIRLPDELRNSDSFDGFKQFLKTILFSRY